jgi:hypothetical protein
VNFIEEKLKHFRLLGCTLFAFCWIGFLGSCGLTPSLDMNPVLARASNQTNRAPSGWFMAGSKPENYRTGVDDAVTRDGQPSAYLASVVPETGGFGTLMQSINASNYTGKRIRLTASIKSENLGDWAGIWMRVDRDKTTVAFDNMQNRGIKGTQTWSDCDVVLDVPEGATGISFGVLLSGTGQVWANHVTFEVVGKDIAVTAPNQSKESLPTSPVNLSFSE